MYMGTIYIQCIYSMGTVVGGASVSGALKWGEFLVFLLYTEEGAHLFPHAEVSFEDREEQPLTRLVPVWVG